MDLHPRTVSQLCGLGQVTWPLCASRFQAVTVDENRYAPLQHVVSPESGSRARESLQGPPCAQSQPCWAPGTLDFPACPTPRLPAPGTAPAGASQGGTESALSVADSLLWDAPPPATGISFLSPWAKPQKEMKCLGPRNFIREWGLRGWCSLLARLSQGILFPKQNFLQYVKAQNRDKSKPCE